eukprot:sb/3466813/
MRALGVIAVIKRNICLLHTYFFTILIVAILEISALIYVVVKRDALAGKLEVTYQDWFRNLNYGNNTNMELLGVSLIQLTFRCCGLGENGIFYWTQWDAKNKVPASCCGNRANPHSTSFFCNRYDQELKDKSCDPYIYETLSGLLIWSVVGVCGFFILLNICQLLCTIGVRRHIERYDEFYSDDESAEGDFTRYSALETASSGYSVEDHYSFYLRGLGEGARFLGRDSFLVDVGRTVGEISRDKDLGIPLTRPQRDEGQPAGDEVVFIEDFRNMTVRPGSSLSWSCEVNQAERVDILPRKQTLGFTQKKFERLAFLGEAQRL